MSRDEYRKPNRFFRILFRIVLALLILAVLSGGICTIQYFRIAKNPPPPVILKHAGFPGGARAVLGAPVRCTTVVRAPWGSDLQEPSLTPGDGTQLVSEPVRRTGKNTWGATDWILEVPLQPYRTGETGKGTLQFSVRGPDGNLTMFEEEIPSLTVEEIDTDGTGGELLIAGEIAEPGRKSYLLHIILGAVLLILAAALTVVLIRRLRGRKADPVMTLRETALAAIRRLRERVAQSRESAAAAMADLTDIVRHFLEKQYHLRAERQTTFEFLRELDRADSPVTDPDRKFLRHFLEAADMVKFAGFTADSDAFENAAFRAEKLIGESDPRSEEGRK